MSAPFAGQSDLYSSSGQKWNQRGAGSKNGPERRKDNIAFPAHSCFNSTRLSTLLYRASPPRLTAFTYHD